MEVTCQFEVSFDETETKPQFMLQVRTLHASTSSSVLPVDATQILAYKSREELA